MMPPIADADPDPTTQIPWPSRVRHKRKPMINPPDEPAQQFQVAVENGTNKAPVDVNKRLLTKWDLVTLSISMAGAQIAWTVELGYGTPFLLGLGLSEHITSLVWLAGPISGLIAQPVIGALSDSSTSKYRRRYWIVISTVALVISTFTLAFCKEIAVSIVDIFGVGAGDWDETRNKKAQNVAIGFAVLSFYVLDFALNGLQASLRNLLLDIAPASQLNAGNAWHARMTNAGNIVGYGFGFFPLAQLPIIRLVGGGQFRKFCVICIVILVITVWMTCYFHEEPRRTALEKKTRSLRDVLKDINTALVNLPKPVRRVCYVQFFAFMGWFPFLFYSTTYVGQVMAAELQKEPDPEVATRTGELAMLLYSIVGVVAGTVLPYLARRDHRLMGEKEDVDEDAELARLRGTVREWRVEAARKGKNLELPVMPFLLRNIWTGAMILFAVLTFSTFFITTVVQATVFITLVGICWAVAMWVPFAIIMEVLKEGPSPPSPGLRPRPSRNRVVSTPSIPRQSNERAPLIRRRSHNEYDYEPGIDEEGPIAPMAGGTVLGIHNLFIVLPQFIVAMVTSIIFRLVDGPESTLIDGNTYLGKTGVAWVLRFGGCCALAGAVLTRRVAPTPTEKAMRRRLGEMRLLGDEPAP